MEVSGVPPPVVEQVVEARRSDPHRFPVAPELFAEHAHALRTRLLMALPSMASSFSQVKAAHSGCDPSPRVFRYEIEVFWQSDHLLVHRLDEPLEQVVGVVRPRRGLRVVLDGKTGS